MESASFAKFIREKRERMGKAQKEIAKILGVSSSTVNVWELGKSTPRSDLHVKIAKFYRMTQDEVKTYLGSSIVLDATELDVHDGENLLPLIKLIASSSVAQLSADDFNYLCSCFRKLGETFTKEMIPVLLKIR